MPVYSRPESRCESLIDLLSECVTENPFKKYLGVCTELHREVATCVKNEIDARQQANLKNSKNFTKEIHERILANEEKKNVWKEYQKNQQTEERNENWDQNETS